MAQTGVQRIANQEQYRMNLTWGSNGLQEVRNIATILVPVNTTKSLHGTFHQGAWKLEVVT